MPDITATRPVDTAPVDTAWGQQVHDILEGIQTGTGVNVPFSGGTTAASSTVTFPRAYVSAPVVIAQRETGTGTSPKIHVWAVNITTTSFTINGATGDGTTSSNTIACRWIAIGIVA